MTVIFSGDPRRFYLERVTDSSGVSGTGRVASGAKFPTGKCVLCWNTQFSSVAVYDSLEELMAIHGHGGCTVLRWIDDEK